MRRWYIGCLVMCAGALLAGACSSGVAAPASTPATPTSVVAATVNETTGVAGASSTAGAVLSPTASSIPDTTVIPAPSATSPASASPAPQASASPSASPAPDAVLIAAGDIASCLSMGDEATAKLVSEISGTVATLGDNVYERGSGEEFGNCYTPTWGAFKERLRPAAGNHEYLTPGAQAYFDYFGAAAGTIGQGYYSYDLGAWHIVVLNSQCWDVGGCGASAPQSLWLKADLAAHPALCTLAYWHAPRFSSGAHGDLPLVQTFWDLLYASGADVVLNGHDHDYERFAPQDPQGRADPAKGIREFVVGTGGRSHYPFPGGPHPNTQVRNDSTYGVLKLILHSSSYDYQFVPVAGQTFTDSGSGTCH